jgi:hypothetical protein
VAGSTTGWPGPEPKGLMIAISAGVGCETRVGSLYSAGAFSSPKPRVPMNQQPEL